MINRLEDKSIPELFDSAMDVISKYNIMFDKILGSTPEEVKETQEALEGLTPAEIRDAVKRFRSGTLDKIRETEVSLEGFTTDEITYAVRLYRYNKPAEIEELLKLLREFNPMQIKEGMKLYERKHR